MVYQDGFVSTFSKGAGLFTRTELNEDPDIQLERSKRVFILRSPSLGSYDDRSHGKEIPNQLYVSVGGSKLQEIPYNNALKPYLKSINKRVEVDKMPIRDQMQVWRILHQSAKRGKHQYLADIFRNKLEALASEE